MTDDVEALRAQLAQARAEAKVARAEATQAKAEAAQATLAAAEGRDSASADSAASAEAARSTDVPAREAPAGPTPSAHSSFVETTTAAYAFDAPSITFGAMLDGDRAVATSPVRMPIGMFNRHLLVAGATGTGKTRTLQLLAEGLSAAGTPVLLCDVKGDLTGLAEPGTSSDKLLARTRANGQDWAPTSFPVELLSLGGADSQFPGATVRTTVSDFGPILLARALDLNTTQEQSLQLIFTWADQKQLELIDLADLRAIISFLTSNEGKAELAELGGVSKATAGVVLRTLTTLESQGGDQFFGEPAFSTADLIRQVDGRGAISLLGVGDISAHPALVSTVIMWLLADLFSSLPEVGDPERPTFVFFFDEAHLLFADATKEFLRQVVQTVRLIRSKGVGIVFVTQTPTDIPSDVLAQLGSRVQHALRAVTPQDQKKLHQTVETFPATDLALDEVLTTLGTGQAVVTVLDPDGRPTPVAPTAIWAPASVMGPAQSTTITTLTEKSEFAARYATAINPVSAEEKLAEQAKNREDAAAQQTQMDAARKAADEQTAAAKNAEKEQKRQEAESRKQMKRTTGAFEKALGSFVHSAGTQLGREITRTIFGTRKR